MFYVCYIPPTFLLCALKFQYFLRIFMYSYKKFSVQFYVNFLIFLFIIFTIAKFYAKKDPNMQYFLVNFSHILEIKITDEDFDQNRNV